MRDESALDRRLLEAVLQNVCGDDPALRERVERLLTDGATAAPASALSEIADAAGRITRIGPYHVLEEIGRGGMGVVYLAEQREPLRRRVAIKVVKLGMDTEALLARFEAERQVLALMNHPFIAQIHEAGSTDRGRPYIAMEYIAGQPLQQFCDQRRLSIDARLELFADVCDGVQHAHLRGVIHRDLKPSNILVAEEQGRAVPKIIDFGVAKALHHRGATLYTEIGRVLGTPEYMSPEQAGSGAAAVDVRADVWSLGVILYELLCGRRPFAFDATDPSGFRQFQDALADRDPPPPASRLLALGEERAAVARARAAEPAELLRRLRGEVAWITRKALARDPARRYQSARELADDVRRLLAGEALSAGPVSGSYRLRKFLARHRLAVAFAATVLVLLTALGTAIVVQAGRVADEAERANRAAEVADANAARARVEQLRAEANERRAVEAGERAEREAAAALAEAEAAAAITTFLVSLFETSLPNFVDAGQVTARQLLDRGAERIRDEFAAQPAIRARLLRTIGNVYAQLGQLDPAVALLADALAAYDAVAVDERSPATSGGRIAALQALGDAQRRRGAYDAALAAQREFVALAEELADPDLLATALDALGSTLSDSGSGAAAVPLFERAIRLRTAARGPTEATLEVLYNNLGVAEYRAGDLAGAAAAFEKVAALHALGPSAPSHAYLHANLGVIYRDQARYEDARRALERARAIVEQSFEPGHELFAGVDLSLAQLFAAWPPPVPESAEPYFERALAHRREHNPGHPLLAQLQVGYAEWSLQVGAFARAEELVAAAVPVLAEHFGDGDPRHGHALLLWAEVRRAAGAVDARTLDLVTRAVAILATVDPEDRRLAAARALGAEVRAALDRGSR